MRYRLGTLLIILAVAPPVLAWFWLNRQWFVLAGCFGWCSCELLRNCLVNDASKEPPMFRFTIRDVLWLTIVIGVALTLGLGWWSESVRRKQAWLEGAEFTNQLWAKELKDNPALQAEVWKSVWNGVMAEFGP
jgi:hypothetical protein